MKAVLTSPWYSRVERNELCKLLFSADVEDQIRAIRHIDVWKARSIPRVPLGIEVTTALIRALVCDSKLNLGHHLLFEEEDVEAAFCMALIRFVNLVTEVGQVMNYQLSINQIAQQMGVPEWIVDLRHSAAHSNLPSLEVLRAAATWSLEWVKINYWEMEECITNEVTTSYLKERRTDIHSVLADIHRELVMIKRKRTSRFKTKMRAFDTEKKTFLENVCWKEFTQEMMGSGLVFPANQQTDCGSGSEITIVERQLSTWKPFLNYLQSVGAIPDLLQALLEEGTKRPSTKGKITAIWILLLLRNFPLKGMKPLAKKPTKKRLYKMMLKMNSKHLQIIESCLPKQKREQLFNLTLKKAPRSSVGSGDSYEGFVHNEQEDTEKQGCPELQEASHCPLGMLPSQYGMQTLDLELPFHVNYISHIHDAPRSRLVNEFTFAEDSDSLSLRKKAIHPPSAPLMYIMLSIQVHLLI